MKLLLFSDKKIWALVGALFLCFSSTSSAGLITTTFAGGNGHAGNMFDVTVFTNPLTVTGLDLNLNSGTFDVEVYTKSGTYVGSETATGDWTLRSTNNGIVSSGENLATFLFNKPHIHEALYKEFMKQGHHYIFAQPFSFPAIVTAVFLVNVVIIFAEVLALSLTLTLLALI